MTEQRERTERKTDEQQQRRRRNDNNLDGSRGKKLAIPPEVQADLDAKGMTARWVNDVGSRLTDLTVRDDYETVDGVKPVRVVIDRKTGETTTAHLLAKRNDFIAEDRANAEKRRQDMEASMMKGNVPSGGNPSNPAQPATVYADKANSIGRENRIIE